MEHRYEVTVTSDAPADDVEAALVRAVLGVPEDLHPAQAQVQVEKATGGSWHICSNCDEAYNGHRQSHSCPHDWRR